MNRIMKTNLSHFLLAAAVAGCSLLAQADDQKQIYRQAALWGRLLFGIYAHRPSGRRYPPDERGRSDRCPGGRIDLVAL